MDLRLVPVGASLRIKYGLMPTDRHFVRRHAVQTFRVNMFTPHWPSNRQVGVDYERHSSTIRVVHSSIPTFVG